MTTNAAGKSVATEVARWIIASPGSTVRCVASLWCPILEPLGRCGELFPTNSKELADRIRISPSQLQEADHAELHGEREVVRDAVLLVPILVHPRGRPNDEAQEHVRDAACDRRGSAAERG